jgi:competence protein ComEC
LLILILILFLSPSFLLASTLQVYFLDVGQGDSMVITASSGEVVMIDSGPDESLIIQKLRTLNISHIDLLIASHPHTDHITGMDTIIDTYQSRAFVDIGIPHTTKTYEYLIHAIQNNNLNYYQATERKISLGLLIFHILPPANPYLEISELNNNSAVIRLDYGRVSFLFPGDIESERESQLLEESRNQLNVDILKVPHHGSFDASSIGFIQAVSPSVAIISCGEDNPYGYPHQETLQTLKDNEIKTYRTDRQGTILVQTDGSSYQVILETDFLQLPEQAVQSTNQMLGLVSVPTTNNGYQYAASKKSKVFHKISCPHAETIKEDNLIFFKTLEEALATGRRGCKNCEPEKGATGVDTSSLPEEVKQNPALKLEIMSNPAIDDGYQYVASKKSKVFHKITCEHVATIKEENLIYFHGLEQAQASGRRRCKQCKPEE